MLKQYPFNMAEKIRQKTPVFYELYNFSILVTYLGVLAFIWYFINLAYTINSQNYNILCDNCSPLLKAISNGLIGFAILNFYFYTVNEIRIRILLVPIKSLRHFSIEKANALVYTISFILFLLTIAIL